MSLMKYNYKLNQLLDSGPLVKYRQLQHMMVRKCCYQTKLYGTVQKYSKFCCKFMVHFIHSLHSDSLFFCVSKQYDIFTHMLILIDHACPDDCKNSLLSSEVYRFLQID